MTDVVGRLWSFCHTLRHGGPHIETLRTLGKQPAILGDIFSRSQNRFTNPVNLHKLIGLIDETEWSELDTDVKAPCLRRTPRESSRRRQEGGGPVLLAP